LSRVWGGQVQAKRRNEEQDITMQNQKSSVLKKILDVPLNRRETLLDKLFQAFFKLLEIVAIVLGKASDTQRK
jgi:hypothetical protein